MSAIKDLSASIRAKLLNIARLESSNLDKLVLLYMQERLLYRMGISKHSDYFILKGGLFLFNVLGLKNRPTQDVDLLARNISNNDEKLKSIFKEIVATPEADGLIFDPEFISISTIAEDASYEGKRVLIPGKLGVITKSLQIDLGFSDRVIPRPTEMEYPVILPGSVPPRIWCYSRESVIAEKFQAMVKLSEVNSRMKDFFDIYSLLTTQTFDGPVLQEAISDTFFRRHTPIEKEIDIFNPRFKNNADKQIQWSAFLRRINSPISLTFSDVIEKIEAFIHPVWDKICKDDELIELWNYEKQAWGPVQTKM